MTGRFDGSVVLITGAAMGIGRAVASRLAADGAALVALDPSEELDGVVAELRDSGAEAVGHRGSVTSNEDVSAAVDCAVQEFGGLDIVISNAGVTRATDPAEISHMADTEWDRVHDVNLKGMFRVARAALPRMRRRGGGVVVCLSSIIGSQQGWGGRVHYAASKAGVEGFVRALAVEVARDEIRVIGVAPGLVETAQTLDPTSAGRKALERFGAEHVPLGFVATPEDIASLVTFLASSEARYLTGIVVIADGGMSVRSVNSLPERGPGWKESIHG